MAALWRWLTRIAGALLVGALVLYGAAVAGLLSQRHALLYRFERWQTTVDQARGPGRIERIEAADGTPLALWVVPPREGRPTVIHFGGNLGVFHRSVARTRALSAAGYGVVVMNYRGASGEAGAPSEAAIVADALATYDALPDLGVGAQAPVVYGASLGAAVAVQLAAAREVGAVVLAAPFSQLCTAAEHHYPWAPACLVLWDERWASIEHIAHIDAPLLVLHGARDQVIPLAEAERLAAAATEPKRLVVYERAGHDDLARHGAEAEILRFLSGL
ncbi:MAG: prolyl oligopeptidase family serine peptidase [Pseudomonadota bacterium]